MNFQILQQNSIPASRLLFPVKLISQSYRNKLSNRFHELDRIYICQKSKQQRQDMGLEYQEVSLVEVYSKTDVT